MISHPNVILMSVFTPDDLVRRTVRAICPNAEQDEYSHCLEIGGDDYSISIMESDYEDSMQISAKEGDFVVHKFMTYGYGEKISLQDLNDKAKALEIWSEEICKKHSCTYKIFIGANYW